MAEFRCSVYSLTILCIILALAQVTAHAPMVTPLFILRLVPSDIFYTLNVIYQTGYTILYKIHISIRAHILIMLIKYEF